MWFEIANYINYQLSVCNFPGDINQKWWQANNWKILPASWHWCARRGGSDRHLEENGWSWLWNLCKGLDDMSGRQYEAERKIYTIAVIQYSLLSSPHTQTSVTCALLVASHGLWVCVCMSGRTHLMNRWDRRWLSGWLKRVCEGEVHVTGCNQRCSVGSLNDMFKKYWDIGWDEWRRTRGWLRQAALCWFYTMKAHKCEWHFPSKLTATEAWTCFSHWQIKR